MTDLSNQKVQLFSRLFTIKNQWENVLYIHTPFCVQKCFYCIYGSKVSSGKKETDHFYNTVIPRQIEQYRGILETVKFDQVYFGGGTPTIIDADRLEELYRAIPHFEDIPLKATEASPYTITDEHIDLFSKYRFTYVSLGVQTLSGKILKVQNRKTAEKEKQKIQHLCRKMDRANIISNVDLIFFLETGTVADLVQAEEDLKEVMGQLKPVSITVHSNYKAAKSLQKQKAMVKLIKRMIREYPDYRCVNSLLAESDMESDMQNGAEFRLMRERRDFNFYVIGKIPAPLRYGHNMLSIGEYETFKLRSNYYYVSDFIDKYAMVEIFKKYIEINTEFEKIRKKLGLPFRDYTANPEFFLDEAGKEKFKQVLRNWGQVSTFDK